MKKTTLFFMIFVVINRTKDVLVDKDRNLRKAISEASPSFRYQYCILPQDSDLENIPQDIRNPLGPEKVALGKLLFYEAGFARFFQKSGGKGTYSCSSCHIPEAGFRAIQPQGIADGGDSPWDFHGGSKTTLDEVLEYKIQAKSENIKVSQELISPKFKPLDLTENEKLLIKEFLEYGLRDPDLLRYRPDSVLSGNCFPNSDIFSLRDMGCS